MTEVLSRTVGLSNFYFFIFFPHQMWSPNTTLRFFLLETLYLQLDYYFKANKNINENEPQYPVLFIPYPLFIYFFKFQG